MKNVKLFLKSLISNNAAIDGARKKPWYAAIIIFFLSLILSVIPSTVMELNKKGDKYFESTTYGAIEATTEFSEYLETTDKKTFTIKQTENGNYLVCEKEFEKPVLGGKFVFTYKSNAHAKKYAEDLIDSKTGKGPSCFIFTPDSIYIRIVDPNDKKTEKVVLSCINAYKRVEKNQIRDALKVGNDKTETAKNTWENWKVLIRDFYNQTRLRAAGINLALIGGVNAGIVLIMGFMVWVLTRGKNNPYRLFTIWESFKIAFWTCPSPAILTVGLGFLISRFASMLFPLLLGVRVMWLTMKSLRPDGTGYAAN